MAAVISFVAACSASDDDAAGGQAGTGGSASKPSHAQPDAGTGSDLGGADGVDEATAGAAGQNDAGGAAGAATQPSLFAIESLLFGMNEGDSSTSYVILLDSLDRSEKVELDAGREFPGYAPVSSLNGKLYAGSGEAPTVTGFEISDALEWKQLDTMSFGNFTSASLEGNVLVDSQHGYVALADKNWVAYNPSALEVGDLVELSPDIPTLRGQLTLQRGYGQEIVGKSVYQPYYWSDATFQSYSQQSQIAVFDTAKAEFSNVLDAPCPHMHITTADEDGNLYFSNGVASIASAVLDAKQPRNCMVRVKPGAKTIDEDFTIDFKDLADGREGSNFFYIGDGLGFFNVYHAERDTLPADATYSQVMYSGSYHLWTLDLKTMKAKIMDGIDYTGGQFVAFHLGKRVFVTIPKADYSSTAVYEVSADGKAEKKFDVQGWAFKMLQVR